ncbi:MAG: ribbon-helix-helix domain-containing protein [Alphaproteobacteria bacterium]
MPRDTELKKRSVRIAGHETSITMEDEFWIVLRSIAEEKSISLNALITEIDKDAQGNLSSAIRVYILQRLQNKLSQ